MPRILDRGVTGNRTFPMFNLDGALPTRRISVVPSCKATLLGVILNRRAPTNLYELYEPRCFDFWKKSAFKDNLVELHAFVFRCRPYLRSR